jgi:beta-lactam-binding protein with PASTA domain/serine/threonine protein kinase
LASKWTGSARDPLSLPYHHVVDERGLGLIGALLEQRYRVDALLARGGMSSVYRGLDTRLDRRVAVKVMDARFADDRAFVDRFEREARSAAKIHHPNVVAVHDQGVDRSPAGDLVYLVMELVDGGTLRDLINERGALDVPTSLAIIEPVLAALTAAHRAGLVHRDVKPENVLIGHGGENGASTVKVGDFGLVRAVHSAGTTSASVILGTVAYLSPEQVTTGAATATGDVYSAGIVLFEMLTGSAPYSGDNAISVAYRHVNDDVPAPSTLAHNLPPELDDLVVRATRRDQSVRPEDGAAFLAEVQKLRLLLGTQRLTVPVPAPTIADRTIPVAPPVARPGPMTNPGGLNLAEAPAERTVTTGQPVSAAMPAVANATIVRPAPGFKPTGPQGTRAMLRTDLDRASAATDFVAPAGPPSGQMHTQLPPRPRPRRPAPPPKSSRGRLVTWSIIGVVVLALVGTTTWWFTSGRYRTVPDVTNKAQLDAEQTLTGSDLNPRFERKLDNKVAAGTVISTDPAKGQEMLRGDTVTVYVSAGRPKVPDVQRGADEADARKQLTDQQLRPATDDGKDRYSSDVPKGKVIELSPPAGTELDIGTQVIMVRSKGPQPKPVPDVRNKTRDEAFGQLQDAGYTPKEGEAKFDPDVDGGRVISTDPKAGTKIEGDDKTVTVVLSNAVTVPDLSGQSGKDAKQALEELGLTVDIQTPFGGRDGGRVFQQSPGGNSRVEPGSKVTLFLFG